MLKQLAVAAMAGGALAAGEPAWKATLTPQHGSKVEGSAELRSRGTDSTWMSVKIKQAMAETGYAWHLHDGTCAAGGGVVGHAASYPQIRTDSAGRGSVDLMLPVAAPASGGSSIHVHAPQTGSAAIGLTVACGDLVSAGGR